MRKKAISRVAKGYYSDNEIRIEHHGFLCGVTVGEK
jgi:hypothetical protein